MKRKNSIFSIIKFARDNYIISLFIAIVAFTLFVAAFKFFTAEEEFVYVKVKVSQGLWWANTNKPNIWMVEAIDKGAVELGLSGKPNAEVVDVRVYPTQLNDQYDIFLSAKLSVDKNKRTGKYTYKRSQVAAGAPIDFEFPNVQFSGTVMALSEGPFEDKYIEKSITLTKKNAYPWEFDAIEIGDILDDGEAIVFEVIDKSARRTNSLSEDQYGNYPSFTEDQLYIEIKANILVREDEHGQILFGQEQVLKPGSTIRIATPNYSYQEYQIGSISDSAKK